MAMARMGLRLAGGLLMLGWASYASAAPTVEQMLQYKPRQAGVNHTVPSVAEQASCKVELVRGNGRASGWVLKDASGKMLRKFYDSNGDNIPDMYSYYLDGVECYREVDTNFNQKIDQYRWLGENGSKWGVDVNEDGKVDSWRSISPEEVSQEILQAVVTKDVGRLQALMLSEAELKALDLPADETGRLREGTSKAIAKFQQTLAGLTLTEKTVWMHLELSAPQCLPGDEGKGDLVRYKHGTILYENAGKHDWLQTGEMVFVNVGGVRAWRLVDGPVPGSRSPSVNGKEGGMPVAEEIKPLLAELQAVDATAPNLADPSAVSPEVLKYNLARAAVLEKIVAKCPPEQREQWIRQVADSLSAAAQNSPPADKAAYNRLVSLRDYLVKSAPNSGLTAYVVFRAMSTEYSASLATAKPDQLGKIQETWVAQLTKFVTDFPTAEDTPDALIQLGMVSEFIGKETDAKNWYGMLTKQFAKHPLASKAQGALKRLNLDGAPIELSGPQLNGGASWDIASLKGKAVLIYYWASWNSQTAQDFAKLKAVLAGYAGKAELVCVNLDSTPAEALAFLAKNPAPGIHLHQAGGLESPLATQYGVMVLPNLFLVGPDGKVVSRTVQVGTFEDELKKIVK